MNQSMLEFGACSLTLQGRNVSNLTEADLLLYALESYGPGTCKSAEGQ